MFHLTWSIQAWTVGLAALIGLLLALVSSSWSCPDDLAGSARACFSSYALRLQSIKQSPQKLCCGLDVEVFRSFCRSYVDGSRCEQRLRGQCPIEKQRMIDNALVSLDGARDALNHLCLDDNIVEKYAMYQSCFFQAGPDSEACFAVHLLGNSDGENSIRFLETVSATSKAMFCRKMMATVQCVQSNVEARCGQHAATLAAILVKPMVKGSTECDYTVDVDRRKQSPREPYQSNPAYISDDGNSKSNNNQGSSGSGGRTRGSNKRNAAATLRPSLTSVALLVSLLIYLPSKSLFSS